MNEIVRKQKFSFELDSFKAKTVNLLIIQVFFFLSLKVLNNYKIFDNFFMLFVRLNLKLTFEYSN